VRFDNNTTVQDLLKDSSPKRLLIFARLEFPSGTVRAHTGVGTRTLNAEEYHGIGGMGRIGALKETGATSANRLQLSIIADDQSLLASVINQDPNGGEAHLHLVKLDEHRQIVGSELLFAGDIVDFKVERGMPYQLSVTASDWFEVWSQPVTASKVTHASQQHLHPGDMIFDQVETIAQGIDDTIPGKMIGSHRGPGRGQRHR